MPVDSIERMKAAAFTPTEKKWDFTPEEKKRYSPLKLYWDMRIALAFLAGGLWAGLCFLVFSVFF